MSTPDIVALTQQMSEMTTRIVELEKALKKSAKKSAKKGSDEDKKPKKPPTPWNAFQARVATVLKDAELSLGAYANNMQFCSFLKDINVNYDEWADDEILEHRNGWTKPLQSKMQIAGKSKRPPSLPASDDESVKKPVKKAAKKAAKEAATPLPAESESESEPVKKPVKKVAKKAATPLPVEPVEEYDGNIDPIKIKDKMYQITEKNDVINEDTYTYMGRYNKETKTLDKKFPQPAYVKKLLNDLKEANE